MDARAPEPTSTVVQPRRRLRWLAYGLLALLLAGVAGVLVGLGFLLMGYASKPGPGRGRLLEIEIVQGASVEDVAARIATRGGLTYPQLFALYARLRGAESRLHEGRRVLVYDNMQPRELLQRVARGYGLAALRVVIPEGFSRFDIAARLARFGVCEREAFLRATEDPALLRELGIAGPSAEGFLFPDTYELREGMEPAALVRRFVANARKRMAGVFEKHPEALAKLRDELGFDTEQLLTLASIVEKEARLAKEQPIIAGVFLNRLRDPSFKPKRLQADPTVSYGCLVVAGLPACAGAPVGSPTRAMLADAQNPYNTYRHEGLPPGPIANPGLPALAAVLAPAAHDYLYFVAQGGGAHAFSRSLEEHNRAVDQQRNGAP